ncbi:glycogen synthase GlgA [Thiohalocapsa marina]
MPESAPESVPESAPESAEQPAFPDTAAGTHLTLYPASAGTLMLRWHLEPGLAEEARAAFGRAAPVATIRLLRLDVSAPPRIQASASVGAIEHWSDGDALYDYGGDGEFLAELGLGTADGGWVLLARSNRCRSVAATSLARPETKLQVTSGPVAEQSTESVTERVTAPVRCPIPESVTATEPDPEPEPEPESEPEQKSAPAKKPEPERKPEVRAGSGPLRRPASAQGFELDAELLVHGGAAPGTLLDLGGHAYRVGPGGRFSFRLPLRERALILRLLAGVPHLPVLSRARPGEGVHGPGRDSNQDSSMHIIIATPECAPVAKAGGLGDFAHGLSRELALQGHRVEIVLPRYDSLRLDRIDGLRKVFADLWVPYHDGHVRCDVEHGEVDGISCYFIEPHSEQAFFRRGRIYGEPDDPVRFAFYARALLEFLFKSGRQPDIIHCNDWQTGLVPVLLYEVYARLGMDRTRVCFTLHNVGYQGWTDDQVLRVNGLDVERLMTADRLRDPGNPDAVNLLKGGIVFSNFVTTVSPRYAWEVQHTEQGYGLQSLLLQYDDKFGGVLNGIDGDMWNPQTDPLIPAPYGPETLERKARNRSALRERLRLADGPKPVVSVVSRLDRQKGVELIRHGIFYALEQGCQFVLLGSALEPALQAEFAQIARELETHPDCHLELGYDEELAHLIYAAADMILIPSVYEPCGLTQMIAMRYGCVPVVRRVGGLADTVFDANYSDRPFAERNGYVFDDFTPAGLESALGRAIGLWRRHPEYFRQLRLNGMRADHSWAQPAQHYQAIYRHIRVQRSDGVD